MDYFNQASLPGQCAAQSVGATNELFVSLMQTLLASYCAISPPQLWPKDYGPTALQNGKNILKLSDNQKLKN